MLNFQINDNPFRCDCRLVEFAQWLQDSGIPRSVEPTCYSPKRLAGKKIINVSIPRLACLPQVEPAATFYSGTSSDTLLTLVQDDIITSQLDGGKDCYLYSKFIFGYLFAQCLRVLPYEPLSDYTHCNIMVILPELRCLFFIQLLERARDVM